MSTEQATAIDTSGSLADHQAAYGPSHLRETRTDDTGRTESDGAEPDSEGSASAGDVGQAPSDAQVADASTDGGDDTNRGVKGKHRAQKDKAGAQDAPRIQALVKEREDAKRERDHWKTLYEQGRNGQKGVETGSVSPASASNGEKSPVIPIPLGWDKPEPKIEDFANEVDPYGAYLEARFEWKSDKKAFESAQAKAAEDAKTSASRAESEQKAAFDGLVSQYNERAQTFASEHADFSTKLDSVKDWPITPLAQAVILLHDKGPELMYHLIDHPDEWDDLMLATGDRPVTEQNVALATRRLERRLQPAPTGSGVTPQPRKPLPPPPNPVRTVPSASVDQNDEAGTLSDHERRYAPKGRR